MKFLYASMMALTSAQEGVRNFQEVTCPALICGSQEGDNKMDAITKNTCYLMQREEVNLQIFARECYDQSRANKKQDITFCGFNAQNDEYAWVDENLHRMEELRAAVTQDQINAVLKGNKPNSQFKDKKLSAECKQIIGVRKDLLPGRFCTESYQCRSSYCKEQMCQGRAKDESCSKHEDCNNGLYCRMKENWPFDTTCTRQKNIYEQCYDDYECQNNQFCWYPSKEFRANNPTKVCLEMYSQDVGETFGWETKKKESQDKELQNKESEDQPTSEDFMRNGMYCTTGLAYPISKFEARCAAFKEMKFDDSVISAPFKCDPKDPKKKCQLFIDIHEDDLKDPQIMKYVKGRDFVNNDCKCALEGTTDQGYSVGYCSSIIGTHWYEKAVSAQQHMMSASSCHTIDRKNMRAQKDQKCGIGAYSNDFRFAVDKMFNVTYWPYIQKEETFKCIRRFFSDSYDSLILEQASKLTFAMLSLISLASFILV